MLERSWESSVETEQQMARFDLSKWIEKNRKKKKMALELLFFKENPRKEQGWWQIGEVSESWEVGGTKADLILKDY